MVVKKKKTAHKEEDAQSKYDHPDIRPSRVDPREVSATIKLAAPVCSQLEFVVKLMPTSRVSYIEDLIIRRHGGSIKDLSICVNRFHPEEIVSADATLEDCGVTGGECIIYYDFVPISGALLK